MAQRMSKRVDGRYTVTSRVEGRRLYGYGKTQAAARADLADKVERAAAGEPVRDSSRLLNDWLTEWQDTFLAASSRAAKTKSMRTGFLPRLDRTNDRGRSAGPPQPC